MNGMYFTGFADVMSGPVAYGIVILPYILIIGVIIAAVELIRHFKNKKK